MLFSCTGQFLTEAISTKINLNTNLIICIEKTKGARHYDIIFCSDVFSMMSARALHMRFVHDKLVKTFKQ